MIESLRWREFTLVYVAYMGFLACRKNYGLWLPAVVSDLGHTKGQAGILGSALEFTYGACSFLNGVVVCADCAHARAVQRASARAARLPMHCAAFCSLSMASLLARRAADRRAACEASAHRGPCSERARQHLHRGHRVVADDDRAVDSQRRSAVGGVALRDKRLPRVVPRPRAARRMVLAALDVPERGRRAHPALRERLRLHSWLASGASRARCCQLGDRRPARLVLERLACGGSGERAVDEGETFEG